MRTRLGLFLLLGLALPALRAWANEENPWWDVDLKPQVIGKDSGDPTLGIGISKKHQTLLFLEPGRPYEIHSGFELESLLAMDAEKNPEPTMLEGQIIIERDFDAGTLSANLHGAFETDQRFDNANAVGGVALLYAPPLTAVGLWPPGLNAAARIDYVEPTADENREDVGVVDQGGFIRLGLSAAWWWRPTDTFSSWTAVKPLSFSVGYRYFREEDQQAAWEEKGFDEYDYVTGMLSWYRGTHARLREIYVQVSDGRMPTGAEDDTTYFLGFVVDPLPSP